MVCSSLKILQWNCNSFTDCRQKELEDYCNFFNVDIIAINDARIAQADEIKKFSNFEHVSISPDLVVFISKSLKFQVLDEFNSHSLNYEIICIQVESTINLLFGYLRNGSGPDGMEYLLEKLEIAATLSPTLAIGDFNARGHCVQGNEHLTRNTAGRVLDHFIESQGGNFGVYSPMNYTFHRPGKKFSTLDICISSESAFKFVKDFSSPRWFDSDHYPTMTIVELDATGNQGHQHQLESMYKER